MSTEVIEMSNENFDKLCDLAGLTDAQRAKCKSISVECEKFGWLEVKVEYYVTE